MKNVKLKIAGLVIILLWFMPHEQIAQTVSKPKPTPDYKVNVLDNKAVSIEFETDKIITNILIIVMDHVGNTLFLDNQRDFKGSYKCSIDMSKYNKGDYYVKIRSDGVETKKKLNIQ